MDRHSRTCQHTGHRQDKEFSADKNRKPKLTETALKSQKWAAKTAPYTTTAKKGKPSWKSPQNLPENKAKTKEKNYRTNQPKNTAKTPPQTALKTRLNASRMGLRGKRKEKGRKEKKYRELQENLRLWETFFGLQEQEAGFEKDLERKTDLIVYRTDYLTGFHFPFFLQRQRTIEANH